jgi:hypothetical protein
MTVHPVGAELFLAKRWTDGQTDMTKLTLAFRNIAKLPKSETRQLPKVSLNKRDQKC